MLSELEKYPKAAKYMQTFGRGGITHNRLEGRFTIIGWDNTTVISWTEEHVMDIEFIITCGYCPRSNSQHERYSKL
jgi:hypothetical protein